MRTGAWRVCAAAVLAVCMHALCVESWQWQVVNLNNVSGKQQLDNPNVYYAGTTSTFEECRDMCAKNASCLSMDWADSFTHEQPPANPSGDPRWRYHEEWLTPVRDSHTCNYVHHCYFRSDTYWNPVPGSGCNHTAARKVNAPPSPNPPLGYQPNIIFILTDDQDIRLGRNGYSDLGSIEAMPSLQENLLAKGASFKNFFVNTPICCPSRTETFTGRYYHNIGPPRNPGNCMNVNTTPVAGNTTGLFGILGQAGYVTGVFGKVTNDQQNILDLAAAQGSMSYVDSPLDYNNYECETYFRRFPNGTTYTETLKKNPVFGTVYQTTQIGNRTLRWLDQVLSGDRPFFAYIGPHAPHFPAEPAPWYRDAFPGLQAPVTPNYNLSSPDKAQHIRQNPPFIERVKCWEDQHFRDRWQSLLSVDDIITAVIDKVQSAGKLNTTFIFYSSDHGFKQGQWRLGTSKQHPFETDIRVPLIVRGPGVSENTSLPFLSGNVDILPTLLDLAAGEDLVNFYGFDGRSLVPFLLPQQLEVYQGPSRSTTWRDSFITEYLSVGNLYNNHSNCWYPPNQPNFCGGPMPSGPHDNTNCVESSGVGTGNCYFIDSTHSNSWRALRILNETMNLQYIEYDPKWHWNVTDPSGAGLQWYELYDLNNDEYQVNNLYASTSFEMREALHNQLSSYYACAGSTCP